MKAALLFRSQDSDVWDFWKNKNKNVSELDFQSSLRGNAAWLLMKECFYSEFTLVLLEVNKCIVFIHFIVCVIKLFAHLKQICLPEYFHIFLCESRIYFNQTREDCCSVWFE